ncbi:MAG: phospholipid carrier-dependent glycosyltransferase [Clostridiales bacterium]|nr:phospholipid carrier-dependent glycosyltransferase [Clostridiales bacterium]
MKKKTWYFLGAGALLLIGIALFFLLQPSAGGTYENLIVNGDFEILNQQGMPENWYTDAYVYQGYSSFDVAEGAEGKGAHIQNHSPNDARFAQSVSVSPNTLYRLHGYVKSAAQGGLGANLSIEGIYVFSQSLYDTQGDWQEVTLYGRTGPNQRSVTVYARLGGYSGEATGQAYFDGISLCRVDSVPTDSYALAWYEDDASPEGNGDSEKEYTGALLLMLFSFFYLLLFFRISRIFCTKEEPRNLQKNGSVSPIPVIVMLFIAFTARLITALVVPGYDVDIGCFTAWATQMANLGPANFYQGVGFCDYPPGYLWILWLIGEIGALLGGVTELMVKIPPILADLGISLLLYTEGKKHLTEKGALSLSILYAFNPLSFVAGPAWGQTDAIMTLMLMLVVFFALKHKWIYALPIYMAAVLVKPQALMFGPLGVAALLAHVLGSFKKPENKKAMLRDVLPGLGFALLAALVMVLPFSVHQTDATWLISLYTNTMGQYGYATVNACNLYFLLGKNWINATTLVSGDVLIWGIAYLLVALPLLASWLVQGKKWADLREHREDRTRTLVFAAFALLLLAALVILALMDALTYAALGTCMIVYAVGVMAAFYFFGQDEKNLPLLGGCLLVMLYSSGSMMHERYIFPAAALLLWAYALKKDKRILYLAVAVTVSGLLNVGSALDRNIRIGGSEGHLSAPAYGISSDRAFLEYLSAIINCILCSLSILLCSLLCRKDARIAAYQPAFAQKKAEESSHMRTVPLPSRGNIRKMTGKDYLIMLSVTVLYAALAFTNLGSMKAPQNGWASTTPSEQVVIDLGQEQSFHMAYFGGIHQYASDFTVETSQDGVTWIRSYTASMSIGDCFKWKYVSDYAQGTYPAQMSGRYVRLTADHLGLTLFEVVFRDAETQEMLVASSASDSIFGKDASALIDEPDTMEGEPGWYNSTYFDEIYHARTAYEHLHSLPTYETTHPPLGKVIMSWFIALFGMTPFGWRFAGALAGVLMLPGMYLLGKLLIKKSWGGIAAMLLMALDLMHFTQTRIATIDSFVVLFIIWAVYCMLRWFFLDFFALKFWKTLIPLGLSGLFMGLSVASKWTGCYAGVGLAILFFFGLWRRYREVRAAQNIPEKQRNEYEKAAANGVKFLLFTIASCFIFFIAVPLVIYYCSYIPYFAYIGGVTVERVIQAAEGMLNYHATPGLGMDHDFYSPWYQWPIIGKPMWYASSAFEEAGLQSSIMALGNPAVWWTGLIGLLFVIFLWARRHVQSDYTLSLHAEKDDPRYALLLICFAAQYLPWVLVPRGTYIYHYFPSVPFIILCTALSLEWMSEKWEKAARIVLYALLGLSALLFIAFFPYASGVSVSQSWMDAMKWFPRWLWY